jgi:hypothetical protein
MSAPRRVRLGSFSTELSYPHRVRSAPDSDRLADILVRQLVPLAEVIRSSSPPPADVDRVFEAFYTRGGLGLGLSIYRSIIEAHNGQLWASATLPRGATFEFTVSAHPDNAS